MPTIDDLMNLPDRIEKRSDYIRGRGYRVKLRTVYTRTRKVRALSEEDAETYALAREAQFAPKYFHSQNHIDYEVESIEAVSVELTPVSDDE